MYMALRAVGVLREKEDYIAKYSAIGVPKSGPTQRNFWYAQNNHTISDQGSQRSFKALGQIFETPRIIIGDGTVIMKSDKVGIRVSHLYMM